MYKYHADLQLVSRYRAGKENEAELSLAIEVPESADDSSFVEATWPTGKPYQLQMSVGLPPQIPDLEGDFSGIFREPSGDL